MGIPSDVMHKSQSGHNFSLVQVASESTHTSHMGTPSLIDLAMISKKANSVRTRMKKAHDRTSDQHLLKDELHRVQWVLKCNGYPKDFVRKQSPTQRKERRVWMTMMKTGHCQQQDPIYKRPE